MPEASDKGSQPYSCPLGDCEMAGTEMPPNNISLPLGRRHEQPLSLTYGKVLGVGVALTSHLLSLADANSDLWFAVPKGTAVWLATIV